MNETDAVIIEMSEIEILLQKKKEKKDQDKIKTGSQICITLQMFKNILFVRQLHQLFIGENM